MSREGLEVADVFRRFGPAFRDQHGASLSADGAAARHDRDRELPHRRCSVVTSIRCVTSAGISRVSRMTFVSKQKLS